PSPQLLPLDERGPFTLRALTLPRLLVRQRLLHRRTLGDGQTELAFQLSADLLGSGTVVVFACTRTVLGDHLHGDVDVVVAVLRQAVSNGDPPGSLRPVRVDESHAFDELFRDHLPCSIRQWFIRSSTQRQGAVPHVRVGLPDLHTLPLLRVPATDRLRDGSSEHHTRLVECATQRQRIIACQLRTLLDGRQRGVVAGDDVRVLVLVRTSWSCQVHHEAGHAAAADDVRDHWSRISAMRSPSCCTARIVFRTSAAASFMPGSTSSRALRRCAIWFTLLPTRATWCSSFMTSKSAASRSRGVSNPPAWRPECTRYAGRVMPAWRAAADSRTLSSGDSRTLTRSSRLGPACA